MQRFRSSYEYLKSYDDLKDGYYDYWINGSNYMLFTRMQDRSGWIRVVTVDWNSQEHLNADEVKDVKLSDEVINALRTDVNNFNMMAEAAQFKAPFNEWLSYPIRMYVHKSMEKFSSIEFVENNPGSTLVSIDGESVIDVYSVPKSGNVGFGSSSGDTFFAYGNLKSNGFVQSFSGPGRGEVFVR